MNCYQARALLSSYLDDEIIDLDVVKDIEVHLTKGGACEEDLLALQALIKAVREKATYYKAPEGLEAKIRAQTRDIES